MLKLKNLFISLVAVTGLMTVGVASPAQPLDQSSSLYQSVLESLRAKRKEPPAEKVEACKDKKEGDSCEFEGRHGKKVTGTCKTRDKQLVCSPEKKKVKKPSKDEPNDKPGNNEPGEEEQK